MEEKKLRPSSAERWLNCTGSVEYGSIPPTEHTNDGIEAHKLIEAILTGGFDSIAFPSEEMKLAIAAYIQYIWPMAIASDDWGTEEKIFIEKAIGFGTCDFWAVEGKMLHIVDFKYGTGKRVFAHQNPQLMLYAYGMWRVLDAEGREIEDIVLHIVQPRKNKRGVFDKYTLSLDGLNEWINGVIIPVVNDIYCNRISFKRGHWCWFCAGKKSCPAVLTFKAKKYFGGGINMNPMDFILRKGYVCAYPHLDKKVESLSGTLEYQVTIVIPNDDAEASACLQNALVGAIKKGKDMWEGKSISIDLDDILKESEAPWAEGCKLLKLKNGRESIPIIGANKEYMAPTEIKAGDILAIHGTFYPYNTKGRKGITCYLNSIFYISPGEPISNEPDPMDIWFPE
jgi:hypothetical protein